MKYPFVWAASALLALVPLAGAGAVDVINEDDSSYVLTVDDGDTVQNLTIGAGATLKLECLKCVVGRDQNDAVEAVDEEVIVIREGQLSVEG